MARVSPLRLHSGVAGLDLDLSLHLLATRMSRLLACILAQSQEADSLHPTEPVPCVYGLITAQTGTFPDQA